MKQGSISIHGYKVPSEHTKKFVQVVSKGMFTGHASYPLRSTLDEGPGSNFLGTNLDWFDTNWILELDCTLVPSLILGSPNQELSF